MINQVVEVAGLSRLLARVNRSLLYLDTIKRYVNTPFSNSLIVTNETMLALEAGCMKVMNTLASSEYCQKMIIGNTEDSKINATSMKDG